MACGIMNHPFHQEIWKFNDLFVRHFCGCAYRYFITQHWKGFLTKTSSKLIEQVTPNLWLIYIFARSIRGQNGETDTLSDCKVHGDNVGPTWALSAPGGPHVGRINLAIRDVVMERGPPHRSQGRSEAAVPRKYRSLSAVDLHMQWPHSLSLAKRNQYSTLCSPSLDSPKGFGWYVNIALRRHGNNGRHSVDFETLLAMYHVYNILSQTRQHMDSFCIYGWAGCQSMREDLLYDIWPGPTIHSNQFHIKHGMYNCLISYNGLYLYYLNIIYFFKYSSTQVLTSSIDVFFVLSILWAIFVVSSWARVS